MASVEVSSTATKANMGMIIAGYFFAVLGGLIGLAIGASIRNSKVALASGEKVHKYDASSRTHGQTIMIISIVSMVIGLGLRVAMQ